jgi:hypothetical protein
MPAYFCVGLGYFSHRKTKTLIERVGDEAALVPLRFWAYAALNQPDGDFSAYPQTLLEEIAALKNVHKNRDSIKAMKEIGFFDSDMKLHGWLEWNAFSQKRSESARKAAQARWKSVSDNGETGKPEGQGRGQTLADEYGLNGAIPPDKPPKEGETEPPPTSSPSRPRSGKASVSGSGNQTTDKGTVFKKKSGKANAPTRPPSAASRAHSIRQLLKDHPGQPDSSFNFADDSERQFKRSEYRNLKKTLEALDREIAATPHK